LIRSESGRGGKQAHESSVQVNLYNMSMQNHIIAEPEIMDNSQVHTSDDHEMSVCVNEGEETRMGSHLIQKYCENPHFFSTAGERSTDASLHQAVAQSFISVHPSFNLSRAETNEIER
jgi:hypothetical protein